MEQRPVGAWCVICARESSHSSLIAGTARDKGEERAVRGRRYPRLKERMEALTVRPRGVRVRGLRAEGGESDGGERGDEPGWGEGEAAAAVRGRGSART